MSSEIVATIVGAGIALAGGIAGALIQHFLHLRAERKKLEWAVQAAIRARLTEGSGQMALEKGRKQLLEEIASRIPPIGLASARIPSVREELAIATTELGELKPFAENLTKEVERLRARVEYLSARYPELAHDEIESGRQ